MPIHIALFRGLNVGRSRRLSMVELRGLFARLGAKDVVTYVQSGNVVFRSEQTATKRLEQSICKDFESAFGYPVSVLTRSAKQWDSLVANNPYLDHALEDGSKVHAIVLDRKASAAELEALPREDSVGGRWVAGERVLYLHTPQGLGNSKLAESLTRRLPMTWTQRNWRTVEALQALSAKL